MKGESVRIYGEKPDDWTYEWRNGRICVHAWGVYPSHSVLAGQACKQFVAMYDTVEEATKEFPQAFASHPMLQEQNTFDHLPDEPDL